MNWHTEIFLIYSTILFITNYNQLFIDRTVFRARSLFLGVHHGKLHPLWDIEWGDTSFDNNAFKAHSKQKDIKQDDCIHYGTLDGAILLLISMLLRLILNKRTLNRAILFFYLNAFTAYSKQWAGFFRAVRLFNAGISDLFFFCV